MQEKDSEFKTIIVAENKVHVFLTKERAEQCSRAITNLNQNYTLEIRHHPEHGFLVKNANKNVYWDHQGILNMKDVCRELDKLFVLAS